MAGLITTYDGASGVWRAMYESMDNEKNVFQWKRIGSDAKTKQHCSSSLMLDYMSQADIS